MKKIALILILITSSINLNSMESAHQLITIEDLIQNPSSNSSIKILPKELRAELQKFYNHAINPLLTEEYHKLNYQIVPFPLDIQKIYIPPLFIFEQIIKKKKILLEHTITIEDQSLRNDELQASFTHIAQLQQYHLFHILLEQKKFDYVAPFITHNALYDGIDVAHDLMEQIKIHHNETEYVDLLKMLQNSSKWGKAVQETLRNDAYLISSNLLTLD